MNRIKEYSLIRIMQAQNRFSVTPKALCIHQDEGAFSFKEIG